MGYDDENQPVYFPAKRSVSPQDYLDSMAYARGYSTLRHNTLKSAYFNRPTPLQEASYHAHIIDLVRSGNARALRAHVECGLSSNPTNMYGESLVHKVCRIGRSRLLQVMLECGVDVRVADEEGRSPMHEACAANSLECFEIICEEDLRMLYMADRQCLLPLQCVPKNAWMDWIQFLEAKKDEFWPENRFGRRSGLNEPPPLFTLQAPNSRPLKDPPNALTFDVAAMVASGQIAPELAQETMRKLRARAVQRMENNIATSTSASLNIHPMPRQLIDLLNFSDLDSELTLSSGSDAMSSSDERDADDGVDSDCEPDENDAQLNFAEEAGTETQPEKSVEDEDDESTVTDAGTHDLDSQSEVSEDRGELSSIDCINDSQDRLDSSLNLQGTEVAMGVLGITPRFSPSYFTL